MTHPPKIKSHEGKLRPLFLFQSISHYFVRPACQSPATFSPVADTLLALFCLKFSGFSLPASRQGIRDQAEQLLTLPFSSAQKYNIDRASPFSWRSFLHAVTTHQPGMVYPKI